MEYTIFEGQFGNNESIEIEVHVVHNEVNIKEITEDLERLARRKWGSARPILQNIYMKAPETDEDLESWILPQA